jgi:hypothetical protein
MASNNETQRLLSIKAALNQMTHTHGWTVFKQIANNVVEKAKQDAIDEDDAVKGENLRRKAKAMQDGLRDLFTSVEVVQTFDSEEEPEWFAQLAFQEEGMLVADE